jgi:hypothetical protein
LVLNNNILSFNGNNYLQIGGTAMGTRMASSYANLFMGTLENKQNERALIESLYYGRFLDDLIYIFEDVSMEDVECFFKDLNTLHPNIKLTWNISRESVNFLDVHLSLTKNNQLRTNLHRKNTNSLRYLNFFSEHPHHMKKSIPYSLSLRLKRICSDHSDLHENLVDLRDALSSSGYPTKLVGDAVNKALVPSSDTATRNLNTDIVDKDDTTPEISRDTSNWKTNTKFITPYNSKNPNFSRILENHINILTTHPRGAFDDIVIKTIHKRPKNLSDDLVHSTLIPTDSASNMGIPCSNKRCLACPSMLLTSRISSGVNNFTFDIGGPFTCHTRDCVYLLQCSLCGIQYIGQTETAFNLRLNNHRRDSVIEGPIHDHLLETGYDHNFSHFRWIILKSNFNGSTKNRENFESWSINKFNLFKGDGLNKTPGVFPRIF